MTNLCTRYLSDEDLETWRGEIEHWPRPGTKEWEDEACTKLKIDDETWGLIEDAMDFRAHGLLWTDGGKANQPARWWRLVRHAAGLLAEAESEQMKADGGGPKGEVEDVIEKMRRGRRRRR